METRANYVAIGAFVLILFVSALGALHWLYRSSEQGATEFARIIFPEAVTGLSTGGSVLFNGIRVGEVTTLSFAPEGGDNVIAMIRINPRAPIKTDTVAKLGFQGLTGLAYISMTGGSQNAPGLFANVEDDEIPTIRADTSAFTNVVDSAQSVLARVNTTLNEINSFIGENRQNLDRVVSNVTEMTTTLNSAAPKVSGLIDDVASAGREIARAAPQISGVVESTNALLGAVEPDRVRSIVSNVDTFTGNLPTIGEDARTVVANVNGLVSRLDETAGTLGEAVRAVEGVATSIDQDAVGAIVDNVRTATAMIAERAGAIRTTIDDASAIAGDVRVLSAAIASRQTEIEQAIDSVGGLIADARAAVQSAAPAIEQFGVALGVITPERVGRIVDSVEKITTDFAEQLPAINSFIAAGTSAATSIANISETLNGRSGAIDQAISDGSVLLENLRAASAGAPDLVASLNARVDEVGGVIRAIDPDAIGAIVTNVNRFSQAVAAQDERIASLMTAAEATARRVEAIASSLAIRMPQVGTIVDRVEETATSAQTFAAALPAWAETLTPGVENVSAVLQSVDPSAVESLVSNASLFAQSLAEQREPLRELVTSATEAARQAATVGAAISARMPDVEVIVANVRDASQSAAVVGREAEAVVADVAPSVRQLGDAIRVVTPARVDDVLTQVQLLVTGLTGQRENVEAIIGDVRTTAEAARTIATGLEARAPELNSLVDNAAAAASRVREAANGLPELVEAIEPGIRNVGTALSAISADDIATIQRDVTTFTGALAAKSQDIEALIDSASGAATRIEAIASAIAQRMPQIGAVIDGVERAVASADAFAASLPGFAETLRPGIENVSAVLSAVDPAAISAIVADAGNLASTLSAEGNRIHAILEEAETAARNANTVIATIAARAPEIGTTMDNASAAVASARSFADTLPELSASLEPGVENIGAVLSAVDPEAISGIVDEVRALSGALAAEAPRIAPIADSIERTAADASVIAARIRVELDGFGRGLASAEAALADAQRFAAGLPALLDDIRPGVQNVGEVLSGIDGTAIREIVESLREVTATVRDARGDIQSTLSAAGTIARQVEGITAAVSARIDAISGAIDNVAAFTGNLRETGPQIDQLVAGARGALDAVRNTFDAVNAAAINEILADTRRVTQAISARTGEIGAAIDNVTSAAKGLAEGFGTLGGEDGTLKEVLDQAKRIAANLENASARVNLLVDRAGNLLDGPVQNLVANVSGAALGVRDVAGAFASRADQIAGGLARFTRGGLDDLRAVINQGRATLSAIEAAVSSFDRNPSRVIFGGADGPRYQPQRR